MRVLALRSISAPGSDAVIERCSEAKPGEFVTAACSASSDRLVPECSRKTDSHALTVACVSGSSLVFGSEVQGYARPRDEAPAERHTFQKKLGRYNIFFLATGVCPMSA